MPYTPSRVWWRVIVPALAIAFFSAAAPAHAHLHWTHTNSVGSDTAALYHFDEPATSRAVAASPLPTDLSLTAFSGEPSLGKTNDTPGAIFDPSALELSSSQVLRSTTTLTQLDGDLSIECWFKWSSSMTSATLEIGLQSGAKILVARDTSLPANDRFGISATHGSFIAAPGFISWDAVGEEEAGLNEWRHLALAIDSAGLHYDPAHGHDVYSTGTIGCLYLNGHPVGSYPHIIDLGGLKVHDTSRVTVIMRGGGMMVDEFSVWRRDWSDGGTTANPFSNGRGGNAAVDHWQQYNHEP